MMAYYIATIIMFNAVSLLIYSRHSQPIPEKEEVTQALLNTTTGSTSVNSNPSLPEAVRPDSNLLF